MSTIRLSQGRARLAGAVLLVAALSFFAKIASSHDPSEVKAAPAAGAKIAKVFNQVLPEADYRTVSVITVDYGPGGSSPKHRHDVAVFAYVVSGEVESQLAGQELQRYKAGQMWYEPPSTIHAVSRNASKTEPARLLVFFVQEEGKAATTIVK